MNSYEFLQQNFEICKTVLDKSIEVEQEIRTYLAYVEEVSRYNQFKVLKAFQKNRVSDIHFAGTTGYGYDDLGREVIDRVYADTFGVESALVRHNIISGTHAISLCLFAVLRPGDTLLAVTGKPYDTLHKTIMSVGNGSLRDFGVNYKQVDLINGEVDFEGIKNAIDNTTKAVLIQKSKGYEFRKSFNCEEVENIISVVKGIDRSIICIVDNCYGEFVEKKEPKGDLIAGSLIKNPGGGFAPTGGYIAGREEYVELASYKLNAVGLGRECGATLGLNRAILQGFFMAPHIVGEAVKSAIFCSALCKTLGFDVLPTKDIPRSDIIQAVKFNSSHDIINFCQGIQSGAPIDSFVSPTPWAMPGYDNEVIMAAGAFNQGASIELSADAPIREPYAAYVQGGLTYDSAKVGIMRGLSNILTTSS